MRCDIRHLNAIDIVVFADHVVEAVFPVHCDQRHAVIVNISDDEELFSSPDEQVKDKSDSLSEAQMTADNKSSSLKA